MEIKQVLNGYEKREICKGVLQELPEWFSIPEALDHYVEQSLDLPFWAAETEGETAGFLCVRATSSCTIEVYVMGVLRKYHRQGIGKSLYDYGDERFFADVIKSPMTRKRSGNTMWKCPNCGREFDRKDQHHFCDKKPETIDDYIAAQPEAVQPILNEVRSVIRDALPDAQEKISWSMPTYWQKYNVIHFAAFKNHLGIYPGDKGVEHFSDRIKEYKSSKGAIQFPYNKPVPLPLIAEIAKWCYETGNHH